MNHSLDFAVRIYKLSQHLRNEHNEYVISKQILRSGTSIGANIAEAQGTQSLADWINKFHISFKEAKETEYWLLLLNRIELINEEQHKSIAKDLQEIIALIVSILKSSKSLKY